MAESDGLQIPVGFSLDEARAALKQLEEMARAAGQKVKVDLGDGAAKSAEKAASGFGSLAEKLQAYRREESQQTRTIRFLTGELQGMLPIGSKTAETLGRIGTIFAGGIGWGLAFEGVKFAIGKVVEKMNEAEVHAKEMARIARENEDLWYRVATAQAAGLAAIGAAPKSEIEKQVDAATEGIKKEITDKQEELRKLNQDIDEKLRSRDYDEAGELMKKKFALEKVVDELKEEQVEERKTARTAAEAAAERASAASTSTTYYQELRNLQVQARAQAKALSREAVVVSMDERERIRTQLRYQIDDLEAFGRDDANVRKAIAGARTIANAKLIAIDFKDAKARHDAELEALRVQTDAEYDAADARAARLTELRQKAAALGDAKGKSGPASQLEGLARESKEREALVKEMVDKGVISTTQGELLKTQITKEQSEQRKQILRDEVDVAVETLQTIAGQVARDAIASFSSNLTRSMNAAAMTNRRFTAEFGRLSNDRRAKTLVETGVARNYAEAQAMVAGEARAAEMEKSAAAKEGMAERLAGYAIEWGAQAIAAAASYNWGSAAAYAAAAVMAGAGAATLHSQAAAMTQRRGFTASENDQLAGLRDQAASTSTSSGAREFGGGAAGAAAITTREVIMVIGDPFESPAETARRAARRLKLAKELNLIQADA
jgi:hypothetical protein